MKCNEINIRDPFMLSFENKYYMYGTRVGKQQGFDVYISDNLTDWEGPICVFEKTDDFWADTNFWAPEVHLYKGKFYMLASFKAQGVHRGTQILVCDKPDGVFVPLTDRPVTPKDWECLDGTLYVSKQGTPYMVFCHEWAQIKDGTICAMELSKDLKSAVSEPRLLWKASSANWISSVRGEGNFVTDGPYLYRLEDGSLICLWSSFSNGKYVVGISKSDNGEIDGSWTVADKLVYSQDGGHSMLFKTLEGDLKLIFHSPNSAFNERPAIIDIDEKLLSC